MSCPFKVGDRVRSKHSSWPEATVTEITERGFKYRYDKLVVISPRLGSTTGGEAYREGFDGWERVFQPDGVVEAPERIWTVGGNEGHFYLSKGNFAEVEYVRAPSPDSIAEQSDIDLDPLEFWCDLAEVLGHPRPAKVNPASLIAEVNERLNPDSTAEKARRAVIAMSSRLRTGDGEVDPDAINAITAIITTEFTSRWK
jgi:hypothetical protein